MSEMIDFVVRNVVDEILMSLLYFLYVVVECFKCFIEL